MLHGSQSITRGTLQCSAAEIHYKTLILMQPFLDLEFVLIKPTIKLALAGLLTATVQALFTCLSNTEKDEARGATISSAFQRAGWSYYS